MGDAPASHTLFTIGHSTRTLDEFVDILTAQGVKAIADVRLIPKSRRYPHFADESLAVSLPEHGLRYLPFRNLGGRRRPLKNSPNAGWRNESFRGYADYLATDAFQSALRDLLSVAAGTPTAIMCAEAVPWRCHRSLIADAALVRGWRVLDIMSATSAPPHKLTRFARVDGLTLTYPGETQGELFDTTGEEATREDHPAADDLRADPLPRPAAPRPRRGQRAESGGGKDPDPRLGRPARRSNDN
jgi:hypothetical protein